jgi:hypothetical protein
MTLQTTHLASVLATNSGIDAGYRHAPKQVTPGDPIEPTGAVLKWYAIHPEARPVPDGITRLARAYLEKTPLEARGLGFVLLHRCGQDFYFLIVCTWRNKTVFYKDGDAMPSFALSLRDGEHKGTYCVWELAPVWHEKEAWERFLNSSRDAAAGQVWLRNRISTLA